MQFHDQSPDNVPATRRRRYQRLQIQCRARIRIGNRHYAGYLDNISQGGARLRTFSAIRDLGTVYLRVPDLPPLRCELRWTDSFTAGVAFAVPLSDAELLRWARTRSTFRHRDRLFDCEISECMVPMDGQAAASASLAAAP